MNKVNGQKILQNGWWAGLIVTGVVMNLKIINAFELPKLIWLTFLTTMMMIVVFRNIKETWLKIDKNIFLGILVWFTGLLVYGLNKNASLGWWGEPNRWQGLWFFGLIILIYVMSSLLINKEGRKKIGLVWLVIMGISLVVGIRQKIMGIWGINLFNYAGRIGSSFGQANNWADFVIVGMGYIMFDKRFSKKEKRLAIIIALLVIVLSESRLTGLIWMMLVLIYMMGEWGTIAGSGMALLVGKIINWEGRVHIWQKSWRMIVELKGRGLGTGSLSSALGVIDGVATNQSHNFLMDTWLTGGAISGIAMVAILAWAGKIFFDKKNWGGMATLISWIMVNSFHSQGVMSWVVLAMILSWTGKDKEIKIKIANWQIGIGVVYGLVVAGLVAKNLY